MKKTGIFLLFVFLFSSCAPAATAVPTTTQKPIETATFTPAKTPMPTNMLTPTMTPRSLPITYIYQDNVPVNGRVIQEQAAYKAYDYFSQYADLGSITIYTFSDIELYIDQIFPAIQFEIPTYTKSKFIEDWNAGSVSNTIAKDNVLISSDFQPWKDGTNLCYKAKNVAHEIFHMVQSNIVHHGLYKPSTDYGPPEWLREGSAEVMGHRIAEGLNGCSYFNALNTWRNHSTEANYPLEEVAGEGFSDKTQFWSLAPFALDYLIKIAPKGEKSVIDFYLAIGEGKSWDDAFEVAFGMPVEDFYTEFETVRVSQSTTFDTNVCITPSSNEIKCLGLIYKDGLPTYVFELPFDITSQVLEWRVESNCKVVKLGSQGNSLANNNQLLITVDNPTQSKCEINFLFSDNRQATVEFVVP